MAWKKDPKMTMKPMFVGYAYLNEAGNFTE